MEESMATPADTPTFPAQPPAPPSRRSPGRDWMIRIGILVLAVAGFLVMLRLDVPLIQWRYRHIPGDVPGQAKHFVVSFRDFGQAVPITVALIIICRMDRRRVVIIAAALLAQLFAGIGYNTGKYMVARYRPWVAKDAQAGGDATKLKPYESWLGYKPGLRLSDGRRALWKDETRSFPSGHSAAAFAFAGILAWFYPQLRGLWWLLAAGCAFSRFIDAVHWPSDCWAGAIIGLFSAWLALRI